MEVLDGTAPVRGNDLPLHGTKIDVVERLRKRAELCGVESLGRFRRRRERRGKLR
jgi:hypothetical protein